MTIIDPPTPHRYRTALIGLAIVVGLLMFKLGVDLIGGSINSVLVSSLAYSLALAANFLALVAVACGVGRARRVGVGYAICGWGYFFLALFEGAGFGRVPPLITSLVFEVILDGPPIGSRGGKFNGMIWTAQSLATLAAGLVGSWFAARLVQPDAGAVAETRWSDLDRSRPATPAKWPAPPKADPVHPLDR